MKEDLVEEEEKQPRIQTDFIANTVRQRKIRDMIPGFSIIKNRIISPLLMASEKVVEYMIPEDTNEPTVEKDSENITSEEFLEKEHAIVSSKFAKMSLEDIERKQRKRTVKSLSKLNQNVTIPKNLLNKASDWVDFISDRMPVESKVTRNFVTNMFEISDTALKRIASSCKGVSESDKNINMRFIKPSKKFYNLLMSVWIKMDSTSIFNLNEDAFVEHVKLALQKEETAWQDGYIEPTKAFFNVAKEEFLNQYKKQKDDVEDLEVEPTAFIYSVSQFFTSIKTSLLNMWNSEIVQKSAAFQSASMTNETEDSLEEAKDGSESQH